LKIAVGLIGSSPGWQTLLRQEGVPYQVVDEQFDLDLFSVVILSQTRSSRTPHALNRYLRSGGSVLMSGVLYGNLWNETVNIVPINSLFPRENSPFHAIGLLDIFSECAIPKGANELPSLDGRMTALIGERDGGNMIVLPFDAGLLMHDSRTADKSFYSSHKRLPFEHVSLLSKGPLRKLVARSIELLHHRRGLPYAHKWYYPDGAPTMFAFRVDTDYAGKETIERVASLSRESSIPFSWFVDVKSQERFLDQFSRMDGQEIGIHCYKHETYSTLHENIDNIQKGLSALAKIQVEPSGFAAPYGKWNTQLAQALEHWQLQYSSEFSFDYDNLPSYPIVGDRLSRTLQIPIHPISIGKLKRLQYSTETILEYYVSVAQRHIKSCEPLLFYHHPNDGREQIFYEVFSFLKQHGVKPYLMKDIAAWWKARDLVGIEVHYVNDELSIGTPEDNPAIRVHCTMGDNKEVFLYLNETLNQKPTSWIKKSQSPFPPIDLPRIRKFNPWIPFIHFQDMVFKRMI